MGSFIIVSLWLLVIGITLAASMIIAEAEDRVPRPGGLFFRFIVAVMEWRERQARIVIDRFSTVDRHRDEVRAPQAHGRKQPDQSGISYFPA